jgi:hypothetical protein
MEFAQPQHASTQHLYFIDVSAPCSSIVKFAQGEGNSFGGSLCNLMEISRNGSRNFI